jgi:hypothetical protein
MRYSRQLGPIEDVMAFDEDAQTDEKDEAPGQTPSSMTISIMGVVTEETAADQAIASRRIATLVEEINNSFILIPHRQSQFLELSESEI